MWVGRTAGRLRRKSSFQARTGAIQQWISIPRQLTRAFSQWPRNLIFLINPLQIPSLWGKKLGEKPPIVGLVFLDVKDSAYMQHRFRSGRKGRLDPSAWWRIHRWLTFPLDIPDTAHMRHRFQIPKHQRRWPTTPSTMGSFFFCSRNYVGVALDIPRCILGSKGYTDEQPCHKCR